MKPIIAALKEGKKTWTDLVNLNIPEKTLDRILDYLQYWGLARKEADYWVWYEYSRVFTPEEFNLYLEHSRKLLPALNSLISITSDKGDALQPYAEQHLMNYPEIYQKVERFRDLDQKQAGKLFEKVKGKIVPPDKMFSAHYEKRKGDTFMGRIFGEHVLIKDNVPYHLGPFSKNELQDVLRLLEQPATLQIDKIGDKDECFIRGPVRARMLDEIFELYGQLAHDISILMLKIDHGEPLQGKCLICPKVRVEEKRKG
jgi:hypothetical protein